MVLSMYAEAEITSRAIRAGAAGYVTKDSEPQVLLKAIHKVSHGGRFVDSTVAEHMAFASALTKDNEPHKLLSDREYQVFELLVSGKSSKEIADLLNLSVKTVSTYKTRVMQKLGVSSNIELLRYAVKHGLSNIQNA